MLVLVILGCRKNNIFSHAPEALCLRCSDFPAGVLILICGCAWSAAAAPRVLRFVPRYVINPSGCVDLKVRVTFLISLTLDDGSL